MYTACCRCPLLPPQRVACDKLACCLPQNGNSVGFCRSCGGTAGCRGTPWRPRHVACITPASRFLRSYSLATVRTGHVNTACLRGRPDAYHVNVSMLLAVRRLLPPLEAGLHSAEAIQTPFPEDIRHIILGVRLAVRRLLASREVTARCLCAGVI